MEGNKKDIEKMQELKQAYSEPEMSGEQLARERADGGSEDGETE